jgi:hypothetical protein
MPEIARSEAISDYVSVLFRSMGLFHARDGRDLNLHLFFGRPRR